MLVITNRNIVTQNFSNGVGDHRAFGDKANSKGPNEVRFAHADKINGKWQVRLVAEPPGLTRSNLPSLQEFNSLRVNLTAKKRNCVFFVHGFNQSFEKNLEKSLAMERKHNVEVVAFSWPSNPGGSKLDEYRHARRNALASIGALDSTLERLALYIRGPFDRDRLKTCNVKFSFMAFSLGNLLLQNYISGMLYDSETRIFDNVILCQADVDSAAHEKWVDLIRAGQRVYVTINEYDWVLKWAEIASRRDRLGRTAQNLVSYRASYFDFSRGPKVHNTHEFFHIDTNPEIKNFFTEVLNGRRGEAVAGFTYDSRNNSFGF